MQLTILGGGGFRVPLVLRALAGRPELGIDRVVLHDLSPERLSVVRSVVGDLPGVRVRATTDLHAAVAGTDAVFSAVRVGGAAGRVADERRAIRHGLLGQETVGAGGLCYGLRTLPVALETGRVVAEESDGWLVDFTNPAGLVTEALRPVLGARVVGICDSPTGLVRRVAHALGVPESAADYAGINHLGWLRRMVVDGEDVLPRLLADDRALAGFEEGRLFGPTLLRALGAVPNEYLAYYYGRRDVVAGQRDAPTRGELLQRDQDAFYAGGPEGAAARWEATRRRREQTYLAEARTEERDAADLAGGGYEQVALDVLTALTGHGDATSIVNTVNATALPQLPADAVVELPARISPAGAHALPAAPLELHQLGLVAGVKDAERALIAAVVQHDRSAAERAFALHPLVDSATAGLAVLADLLDDQPGLAELLH